MKNIFCKNKIYSENDINEIANANNLATVDCLKDENMISVEKWNNGDGEDCLFEFNKTSDNKFKMKWSEIVACRPQGKNPREKGIRK